MDQSNTVNYIHWIKTLLLCNRFDGAREDFLAGNDPAYYLVLAGESPHADIREMVRWSFLENADFDKISMTRSGEVIYTGKGHYIIIDQSNPDEGTISLVDYALNGEIKNEIRTTPYFFRHLLTDLHDLTPLDMLTADGFDIRRGHKSMFQ